MGSYRIFNRYFLWKCRLGVSARFLGCSIALFWYLALSLAHGLMGQIYGSIERVSFQDVLVDDAGDAFSIHKD